MTAQLTQEEIRELRRKARVAVLEALASLGGTGRRSDIVDAALAVGGFSERELAEPGPPTKLAQYPRRVEYELSWALTNLKRGGQVTNPSWSVWQLAGAAAAPEPPLAAPVLQDRLEQLRAMPYREYLRTPEWQETRAAALVRAGHRCALDASHTTGLHVHHSSYDRLGEELPSDLTVLCESCHELFHQEFGRPKRPKDQAPPPSFPPPAPAQEAPAAPRRPFLKRLLAG